MLSLTPSLEENEWVKLRKADSMTSDLLNEYGHGWLANEACERLMEGYESFISPLKYVAPKSWTLLNAHSKDACLIETRYKSSIGSRAGGLALVCPVPAGFVSLSVYPGVKMESQDDETRFSDFSERVKRLPEFLQLMIRSFERIYINNKSQYLEVPDVVALEPIPYGSTSLDEFVYGSSKRALTKKFGNLKDLTVVAQTIEPKSWTMFFDDSESSDCSLWVGFGDKLEQIFKLTSPQEAFDAMFEHYLSGKNGDFRFNN